MNILLSHGILLIWLVNQKRKQQLSEKYLHFDGLSYINFSAVVIVMPVVAILKADLERITKHKHVH